MITLTVVDDEKQARINEEINLKLVEISVDIKALYEKIEVMNDMISTYHPSL